MKDHVRLREPEYAKFAAEKSGLPKRVIRKLIIQARQWVKQQEGFSLLYQQRMGYNNRLTPIFSDAWNIDGDTEAAGIIGDAQRKLGNMLVEQFGPWERRLLELCDRYKRKRMLRGRFRSQRRRKERHDAE